MSILTEENRPNISIPREVKLQHRVQMIKNHAKRAYEELVNIQKRGIDLVWNHPEFTPQEIIDALGDNAVKVFQYHGALTEYIVALTQSEGLTPDIKLPTNAFTIDNGVITVTEDPYVLQ